MYPICPTFSLNQVVIYVAKITLTAITLNSNEELDSFVLHLFYRHSVILWVTYQKPNVNTQHKTVQLIQLQSHVIVLPPGSSLVCYCATSKLQSCKLLSYQQAAVLHEMVLPLRFRLVCHFVDSRLQFCIPWCYQQSVVLYVIDPPQRAYL